MKLVITLFMTLWLITACGRADTGQQDDVAVPAPATVPAQPTNGNRKSSAY